MGSIISEGGSSNSSANNYSKRALQQIFTKFTLAHKDLMLNLDSSWDSKGAAEKWYITLHAAGGVAAVMSKLASSSNSVKVLEVAGVALWAATWGPLPLAQPDFYQQVVDSGVSHLVHAMRRFRSNIVIQWAASGALMSLALKSPEHEREVLTVSLELITRALAAHPEIKFEGEFLALAEWYKPIGSPTRESTAAPSQPKPEGFQLPLPSSDLPPPKSSPPDLAAYARQPGSPIAGPRRVVRPEGGLTGGGLIESERLRGLTKRAQLTLQHANTHLSKVPVQMIPVVLFVAWVAYLTMGLWNFLVNASSSSSNPLIQPPVATASWLVTAWKFIVDFENESMDHLWELVKFLSIGSLVFGIPWAALRYYFDRLPHERMNKQVKLGRDEQIQAFNILSAPPSAHQKRSIHDDAAEKMYASTKPIGYTSELVDWNAPNVETRDPRFAGKRTSTNLCACGWVDCQGCMENGPRYIETVDLEDDDDDMIHACWFCSINPTRARTTIYKLPG